MAGALKVWDGSAWQTVSQAGPPGPPTLPAGGSTGQLLTKASAANFDALWQSAPAPNAHGSTHAPGGADPIPGITDGSWLGWNPRFSTDAGYEGGMTAGAGGVLSGAYRMIAPYTMKFHMVFVWGSSGGNGGAAGGVRYSLPPGYTFANMDTQYCTDFVWTGDQTFYYLGLVDCPGNDIWMGPRTPVNTGDVPRYVGTQVRCSTSTSPYPQSWYPNGGCRIWGTVFVNQRM